MTANKVGHATIVDGHIRSSTDVVYADYMNLSLKELAKNRPKKPASTEQAPSTAQALKRQAERHPSEDKEWMIRDMPNCLANPEANTKDELVNKRNVDAQDALLHRSTQQSRNQLGDSKESSVTPKARDRGINAFTYSKPYVPTDTEIKRFNKLEAMDALAPDPSQEQSQVNKKSFWQRLFGKRVDGEGLQDQSPTLKLVGNKIVRVDDAKSD